MKDNDQTSACPNTAALMGRPIEPRPVVETRRPEEMMENMLAFGGAYMRRVWRVLDRAVGNGVPLVFAAAGPITVSGAHLHYVNDLLKTGWFAAISTTDAVCYHDGHRSLNQHDLTPVHEVAIEGRDIEHREAEIIRVTNTGFRGDVLYEQDKFLTAMLLRDEFQYKMSGTEFRHHLGRYYGAQEKAVGAKAGLLSTCYEHAIPVFVGAPGDGSVFLNAMKLWAMDQANLLTRPFKFELDIHREVFESCALHYELTHRDEPKQIGIWILGGGVPKNFALQPEPGLIQILGVDAPGYRYDAQIVGADVKDGSLSSCLPDEAYTWEKLDIEALGKDGSEPTAASMQADYTMVAPWMAQALLGKRARYQKLSEELGDTELFRRHSDAPGYLNRVGQRRLYDRMPHMTARLIGQIAHDPKNIEFLRNTMEFSLPVMRSL